MLELAPIQEVVIDSGFLDECFLTTARNGRPPASQYRLSQSTTAELLDWAHESKCQFHQAIRTDDPLASAGLQYLWHRLLLDIDTRLDLTGLDSLWRFLVQNCDSFQGLPEQLWIEKQKRFLDSLNPQKGFAGIIAQEIGFARLVNTIAKTLEKYDPARTRPLLQAVIAACLQFADSRAYPNREPTWNALFVVGGGPSSGPVRGTVLRFQPSADSKQGVLSPTDVFGDKLLASITRGTQIYGLSADRWVHDANFPPQSMDGVSAAGAYFVTRALLGRSAPSYLPPWVCVSASLEESGRLGPVQQLQRKMIVARQAGIRVLVTRSQDTLPANEQVPLLVTIKDLTPYRAGRQLLKLRLVRPNKEGLTLEVPTRWVMFILAMLLSLWTLPRYMQPVLRTESLKIADEDRDTWFRPQAQMYAKAESFNPITPPRIDVQPVAPNANLDEMIERSWGSVKLLEQSSIHDLSDWRQITSAELKTKPVQPAYFTRVSRIQRTDAFDDPVKLQFNMITGGYGIAPSRVRIRRVGGDWETIPDNHIQLLTTQPLDESTCWRWPEAGCVSRAVLVVDIGAFIKPNEIIDLVVQHVLWNGMNDTTTQRPDGKIRDWEWAAASAETSTHGSVDLSILFPHRQTFRYRTKIADPKLKDQPGGNLLVNRGWMSTRMLQWHIPPVSDDTPQTPAKYEITYQFAATYPSLLYSLSRNDWLGWLQGGVLISAVTLLAGALIPWSFARHNLQRIRKARLRVFGLGRPNVFGLFDKQIANKE